MLNKYPLWKNLLIVLALVFACIYAAPNLYPPDPAIQVTPARSGAEMSEATLKRVRDTLTSANIEFFGEEVTGSTALFRLTSADNQLKGKDAIQRALGDEYIVALNLAPTTPDWLLSMGAGPMTLGLDLSGGVHFLMEVDMDDYLKGRMENYREEFRNRLREEDLKYRRIQLDGQALVISFINSDVRAEGMTFVGRNYPEFLMDSEDGEYADLRLSIKETKVKEFEDYAIKQNLTTLRNRVNELGVAEPLVQRQGRNRIVVELPGVQDTAEAKKILGKAANLEFRLEAEPGTSRFLTDEYGFRNDEYRTAQLQKKVITTGDSVTNAQPSFDENGFPQVNIDLDSKGGAMMTQVTRKAVGKRMAVLFVERKPKTTYEMVDGKETPKTIQVVEKSIISLATIQSTLGNSFRITGLQSAEASELALLLRAGALAAPMYFVEERTVGPSLGKENIEQGMNSVILGLALVLLLMAIYYRVFGMVANFALLVNIVILIALMSMIGATLTLPGIAGIVLTVGMAVDANVLIFARIREELKAGRSPQQAIHEGYNRAFITIFDANLTTLIVAVILFAVGTGPVKGFAVTLSFGIITSMFTAIVLTRAIINLIYGGRRLESLSIGGKV
ncbi:MAG: protein translocase subunit SecD [Oceanospirillaceae bacterium]|uniref:protein translocase subunit SecD n=1 Tax=unclassified Thalassolituus TaxID=2624967 RepID=UPI000C647ED0|nr:MULTISPECIES: protein translocase subunit SecD [unclassified Thalassolituus]MAS26532.1 protein translocase subunit SecD [Oceanospirillaceae bacterium]MAY00020.1 protein translocase subunit SecD [Oceanospirillaceae bacterium]MBS51536.1 protein translocase subunit SecD [Oceanospirillaceae bacterium]|tara:strand:+ start:801 stop:2657 length:1857 start_codon:yes stop_codon:yes gene_type:complete